MNRFAKLPPLCSRNLTVNVQCATTVRPNDIENDIACDCTSASAAGRLKFSTDIIKPFPRFVHYLHKHKYNQQKKGFRKIFATHKDKLCMTLE